MFHELPHRTRPSKHITVSVRATPFIIIGLQLYAPNMATTTTPRWKISMASCTTSDRKHNDRQSTCKGYCFTKMGVYTQNYCIKTLATNGARYRCSHVTVNLPVSRTIVVSDPFNLTRRISPESLQ